jgi:GntR family transcriptional regulator / MocR family aminotransferase
MGLFLELDGQGEVYRQLHRALRQAIAQGRLREGAKLPSTRELAQQLSLARNTVLLAYELLCAEHLAVSKVGSGTYVARGAAAPRPVSRPAPAATLLPAPSRYARRLRDADNTWFRLDGQALRFNLQYGTPMVDVGMYSAWSRALAHAAQHTDAGYPPTQGMPALRQEIAAYLSQRRGLVCDADDVIVVNGTQQAVSLVGRLLLDEGDRVVMEDPSFKLARNCFLAQGAQLSFVPVDDEGLQVEALPGGPVKLAYVTPSHQYPSGVQMSMCRREALLAAAAQRGFWVVEDDYDGEFGLEGRLQPALASMDAHGRVIYVGTFSKMLLPSIRMGYIVAPRALRDDLLRAKLLADIASPGIEQVALAHFMKSGAFERHLRRGNLELRRRRQALHEGVARWCGDDIVLHDNGAGMHCVAWLPRFSFEQTQWLIDLARSEGLGLHAIHNQYQHPPRHPGLLLGFASTSVAQLRGAMKLLGECIGQVHASPMPVTPEASVCTP